MVTFSYFLMTLLMFSGLFLIGLILLQRGRGGGLAGAFGGMGGQSAFGTKAGDVFTRITIGVATAWILLCAGSVVALHHASQGPDDASLFKSETEADSVKKAEPKADDATGLGAPQGANDAPPGAASPKDGPKDDEVKSAITPAPAKPDDAEKKPEGTDEKKPVEEKKAAEPSPADPVKPEPAKPEEPKPEPAKPESPTPEPTKPEEPKPESEKPAEPKPEAAPEKKPE